MNKNSIKQFRIGNKVFKSVDALTQYVIKNEWVKFVIAVDQNGKEKYFDVERSWGKVPRQMHEMNFRSEVDPDFAENNHRLFTKD